MIHNFWLFENEGYGTIIVSSILCMMDHNLWKVWKLVQNEWVDVGVRVCDVDGVGLASDANAPACSATAPLGVT